MQRARRVLGVLAAAATVSMAGLPAASAAQADDGLLRLAHLSPDTPAVDVYVDSVAAPAAGITLTGVDYGTVSDYQQRGARARYAVSMRAAGAAADSPPVLSTTVDVPRTGARTVAGLGRFADLGLAVLDDDLTHAGRPARHGCGVLAAAAAAGTIDVPSAGRHVGRLGAGLRQRPGYVDVPAGPTDAAGDARERLAAPTCRSTSRPGRSTACWCSTAPVVASPSPAGTGRRQPGRRAGGRRGGGSRRHRGTTACPRAGCPGRAGHDRPAADRPRPPAPPGASGAARSPLIPAAAPLDDRAARPAPPTAASRQHRAPVRAGGGGGDRRRPPLSSPAVRRRRWRPSPRGTAGTGRRRALRRPGRWPLRPGWPSPAIGIDSPLVEIGLDAAGALVPPADVSVAGWFAGARLPGEAGPAVLAGHVDSTARPGGLLPAAGRRGRATPSWSTRTDGHDRCRFTVTRVARYPKNAFPTAEVYGPTPGPSCG